MSATRTANRGVCYCRDCQAFACFLGRAEDVLDEKGGSQVIQMPPKHVTFSTSLDALACLQLTPTGLLRWYARCCNTPIGNTLMSPTISFVGLLHSCLQDSARSLDASFGPLRVWANTQSAWGDPKPRSAGLGRAALWFIKTISKARFNGDYRVTPFFDPSAGVPIAVPRVLTGAEHATLMIAVQAARQRATGAG